MKEKQDLSWMSNRRAALRNADSIIVMKDGKIEVSGEFGTLLDTCEEMRKIWR